MPHATCLAADALAGRHGNVFAFKLAQRLAGRSYAVRAAALAGTRQSVLTRAEALLTGFQAS